MRSLRKKKYRDLLQPPELDLLDLVPGATYLCNDFPVWHWHWGPDRLEWARWSPPYG